MKKNGNKNKYINIIQISQNKSYSQFKNKKNKLLIFYIFILFFYISFSNNPIQEITLTMSDGVGNAKILNEDFSPLPNEIYVGGVKIEEVSISLNLNGQNTVKLCYETMLTSLKGMFKDLNQIKEIDLSKFDTSNVQDMSFMFYNCQDLEKINFRNFRTSSVKDMENMFFSCKKIESLDLSTFDTTSVSNMKSMFSTCEGLKSLNLLNFDTFKVTNMAEMFCDCKSLEYLDISTFRTYYDVDMGGMFKYCLNLQSIKFHNSNKLKSSNLGGMFQNCRALTSLDLSVFDTTNTENMEYMFDQCYTLMEIKLSNFNTLNVKNFQNMFSECHFLQSLNLSNFNTQSATNLNNMFNGCNSLIYLNFTSLTINNVASTDNMFSQISSSAAFCFKDDNIKNQFTELNIDCENACFKKSPKLIIETKKCIEDCSLDNYYKYEYNNKCYKDKCPDGTTSSSTNQFLCKLILDCPKYSSMDRTECFDYIPEGYYLSDNNQNLIDICHDNCKTCEQKGWEGNNNCLTCKENLFYDNGNCVSSCTYGSYTDNYGNKICSCNNKCEECSSENISLCKSCNQGYYPKNDEIKKGYTSFDCFFALEELEGYFPYNGYFYLCYTSCKKCSSSGNDYNHNCDKCKDNYYQLLNENIDEKNCYLNCNNYYYFDSNNTYQCTTTKQCPDNRNKLIKEKKKCIDSCVNDNKYTNEYNNTECVEQCPEGYFPENNICKYKETEAITNENTAKETDKNTEANEKTEESSNNEETENIQTSLTTSKKKEEQVIETSKANILDNWSSENFFLGLYIADEKNTLSKDDIRKLIRKDIINHNLDSIIENVIEEKKDKFIEEDNALYQITTTTNQKNNTYTNVSTIKLGECENILKKIYNIDENETLIILKIDYNITGLLIPIIGYEIFHPKNKSKLNLEYCEESSINYNIPVTIDENNLFKYNQNSDYYNDECNTYTTENGTDIILDDRKKEFTDNNMSLCENICDYIGYNSDSKKAICECGIRYKEFSISEINNQNDILANNLTLDNTTSNIGTLKCYDLLFSKEGLLTNIGSYIIIFIIILHLISVIIFYKCGYHIIDTYIEDIIDDKKALQKLEKQKKNKNDNKNPFSKVKSFINTKRISNIYKNKPKKSKKKVLVNPTKKLTKKKTNRKSINNNFNKDKSDVSIYSKSFIKIKVKDDKIINYKKIQRNSINVYKNNKTKNAQNKKFNLNILQFNDFELNTMTYKCALKIDKRTYWEYYRSLLRTKHPFLFSFFPIKDFNILIIKICLFFFSFSIYFALNTILFDYKAIHIIYKNEGSYNVSTFFPQIFIGFFISYYITILIKFLVLSERDILIIKNEKIVKEAKKKVSKVERCIIIRNILYFIISIMLLTFFWYYLSGFCAVYQNSQVHLINNTLISFIFGLIYPLFFNLFPCILRKTALNEKKKECMYKISIVIQLL